MASLNTPFMPANPKVPLMEALKANPIFDYQLYFQEPVSLDPESSDSSKVLFFIPFSLSFSTGLIYLSSLSFSVALVRSDLTNELRGHWLRSSAGPFQVMTHFCVSV